MQSIAITGSGTAYERGLRPWSVVSGLQNTLPKQIIQYNKDDNDNKETKKAAGCVGI